MDKSLSDTEKIIVITQLFVLDSGPHDLRGHWPRDQRACQLCQYKRTRLFWDGPGNIEPTLYLIIPKITNNIIANLRTREG